MTKKQFGIIFTLMALIVCVGVLSMKLNENGLTDPTSLEAVLKQESTNKSNASDASTEETLSTTEYFYSMRLTKEQQDQKYVDDMKAITEDANASQESKDIANKALVEKAKMEDQESRVESEIRNKGYEDALCMINDNKTVKVYVKVEDVLSQEDSASIKKVVEDITTLSDVDITSMK
ncbi:SpoIIIAH-like family protein [Clostridioides difficile]